MGGNFFGNPARLAPAQAELTRLDGGAFVLRSPEPLQPFARCIGEWLEHWAVQTPSALALAARDATGGWRRLTYAELRASLGAIAQGLLDLLLRVGGPIVVLTDNSFDHASLPFLENDANLAGEFVERLRMVFYAGAAVRQASWARLEAVARKVRDEPLWFTTSWAATETSPAITSAHRKLGCAGCIGLPLPGIELKCVPNGEKLEMRVRGPTVFPGCRDAPS